ncbi:hypothetical protein BGP_0754 [Beggiatoa sp. PS]|nr:hypothetical protein BGP_0754 [Beggiatoa sp. PS]
MQPAQKPEKKTRDWPNLNDFLVILPGLTPREMEPQLYKKVIPSTPD